MQHHSSVFRLTQLKFWLPAMVASVLLIAAHLAQNSRLLARDEVDYAVAAGQGFVSNYFDSTALSPSDFIRFIKARLKNQPCQFGKYYDEENDVFIRRHMHPPLLQYLINVAGMRHMTDGRHDQILLSFQFAGGLVLIVLINTAVLFIANKPIDLITGFALATSSFLAAFHLTREIQYHLWFAISLIMVSFGLGRYFDRPNYNNAIRLGVLLGLSFLALETGLFAMAIALFLISLRIHPKFNRQFFRNLYISIPFRQFAVISVVMALTIFLLWPASLLKLSLPRILAIYAYRLYLGNEYAGGNRVYFSLLFRTLPLILAGGIGIATGWLNRRKPQNHYHQAFAGLGLCYGLLMLKFMLNITYMIPALALLSISGLVALVELKKSRFKSIASIILVGLTGWVYSREKPLVVFATPQGLQNLATLIEKHPHPVLIEAGHIYQYYLPELQSKIENITISSSGDFITIRKNMKYESIAIDQMKNHLILFYNRPNTLVSPVENRIRTHSERLVIPGIMARAYLITSP